MNAKLFLESLDQDEQISLLSELLKLPGNNNELDEIGLTPIDIWIASQEKISSRLCHILLEPSKYWRHEFQNEWEIPFIEKIHEKEFMSCRNAGKKTWDEFVKLRGY